MHSTRTQAALGDLKTRTWGEDHMIERHANVVEAHLAMTGGFVHVMKHRQHALDAYARAIEWADHHAMTAMRLGSRVAQPHEDHEAAVRMACAGGPPLAPVEHDFVALDMCGGLHVRCIGRSDIGLGHRKARADL